MTFGGWLILTISIGGFLTLFIACIYKVLALSSQEKHLEGLEKITPLDERGAPLEAKQAPKKAATRKTPVRKATEAPTVAKPAPSSPKKVATSKKRASKKD